MNSTEVVEYRADNALATLPAPETSTSALVLDAHSLDKMMRLAEIMANGRATIPQHLAKNPADCLAVIMQAMQWGMNPFAVAQKTHLVNGTLGYEAQLVNAVITARAPVRGRLNYEWFGDWRGVNGKTDKSHERGVKVWATLKGEDTPRELVVTMAQAGVRNSPLWEQDPRLQLAYLAIKRWSRLHCPDVIMGVYTPDEFDDAPPPEKDITPARPAIPAYPADDFIRNLATWQGVIAAGKKSADEIIAMVESRGTLTDAQKQQIRDAEAPEDAVSADEGAVE